MQCSIREFFCGNMLDRLIKLNQVLVLGTTVCFWALGVVAQTAPHTRLETIPGIFNRAFYEDSGNFFHNNSSFGQIETFLGWGFPENEISHDAEIVHSIYQSVLKQQTQNDPIIRTLDLQNPYNSSLRTNPTYLGNTVSTETIEFIFQGK